MEPLLRQLAYEHGQGHVILVMRSQYVFHKSFLFCTHLIQIIIYPDTIVSSRNLWSFHLHFTPPLDDDGQQNITFVHEPMDGGNIQVLIKLLSAEHPVLTR